MAKPSYFDVFGKRIYIQYKELKDVDGEYKSEDGLIEIDQTLEGKDLYNTLIHELLHAMFDRIGIESVTHHDVEEILCRVSASLLIENDLINIPDPPA